MRHAEHENMRYILGVISHGVLWRVNESEENHISHSKLELLLPFSGCPLSSLDPMKMCSVSFADITHFIYSVSTVVEFS